ncbi:hypothetical protein GGS26DRAFT_515175 [Hypomontagnella submonticulosa]|nr:hypothetical protein GGS26DRAFT_515175 [Hypomontagnella submonticulosa]
MPSTIRTQTSPGIMSLVTPALFFVAALSGSYLFSFKTRHARSRQRDMTVARARGIDYESGEEDVSRNAESQQLVYDSGTDDDFLMVLDQPQFRTTFGVRSGAAVRGYPSYGGVYVLHCTPVELDFLQLDRFHIAMRSSDQVEEDIHCANMRRLGATWWESEGAYRRRGMDMDRSNEPVTFVGWPSGGGIWVLRTTLEDASERGIGRINNCYSMDERCRLIRQMGGTFYDQPEQGLSLGY